MLGSVRTDPELLGPLSEETSRTVKHLHYALHSPIESRKRWNSISLPLTTTIFSSVQHGVAMSNEESFELPNARLLAPVSLKLPSRRMPARGVPKSPSKPPTIAAVLLEV
jgi:hypothetical protein